MPKNQINLINVPGAQLFYKQAGSGPTLLLIAGGSGSADSFDFMRPYLEPYYCVISYDRRGYARSPLQNPSATGIVQIETQSDDVYRLLAALTQDQAYVFGSSLGALIGLDVTSRHPEVAHTLVAHEPPILELIPNAQRNDSDLTPEKGESPNETLRRFAASIGVTQHEQHEGRVKQTIQKRLNTKFFLEHEAPAVDQYRLDYDQLKATSTNIIFGGGVESRQYFPYFCAQKAASTLQSAFVEFPGHHSGYVQHPQVFAKTLRRTFISNKAMR